MSFPVEYLFQIHGTVVTTHVFSARFDTQVFVHVNVNLNVFEIHVQFIIFEIQTSIMFQLYIKSQDVK